MNNKFKKIVAAVAALAVAFTAVVATDVTTAQAATDDEWESLYTSTSEGETAAAGVEAKYSFTVDETGDISILIYAAVASNATLTMYNSAGVPVSYDNNPLNITSSAWKLDEQYGLYYYEDVYGSLAVGDYQYGIKFDVENKYLVDIAKLKEAAKISETKATITAGFTKKLSVTGAKVKKWSSSKTAVATVDQKGKVTAKKAGKATISAKLDNGKTVKCVVTVKANKYTASKLTTSDVPYGECGWSAYSASFDSKGNLVVKVRAVNNFYYKVSGLENVKITVKDANGKLVGQTTVKKKVVTIPTGSTKDLSFTISKSSLKKKTADLRNATITCGGTYYYYY